MGPFPLAERTRVPRRDACTIHDVPWRCHHTYVSPTHPPSFYTHIPRVVKAHGEGTCLWGPGLTECTQRPLHAPARQRCSPVTHTSALLRRGSRHEPGRAAHTTDQSPTQGMSVCCGRCGRECVHQYTTTQPLHTVASTPATAQRTVDSVICPPLTMSEPLVTTRPDGASTPSTVSASATSPVVAANPAARAHPLARSGGVLSKLAYIPRTRPLRSPGTGSTRTQQRIQRSQ